MNVNLPIEDLIDAMVKAMKPERSSGWPYAIIALFIVVSVMSAILATDAISRLSRLETIVATDREFSHGVAGMPTPARKDDAPAAPVVPIQPRAIAESEIPKPGEGQP